jgi:hypothetical protein
MLKPTGRLLYKHPALALCFRAAVQTHQDGQSPYKCHPDSSSGTQFLDDSTQARHVPVRGARSMTSLFSALPPTAHK